MKKPTPNKRSKMINSTLLNYYLMPQGLSYLMLSPDLDCFHFHNSVRITAGLREITWNESLAINAANWAFHLQTTNQFYHTPFITATEGQSLFKTTAKTTSCLDAAKCWFSERNVYHGEPIGQGDFHAYGHFSQMMIENLESVGCGVHEGVAVCHYYPAQQSGVVLKHI